MSETRSTYSRVAIILHWLIGLAIIGNLAGGLLHESFGKANVGIIMGLHKATGIAILFLSLARLAWRLGHRPPPLAATVKRWETGLAHAVHWSFYLFMMAIPLTGWLMTSAGGRKYPISFYGLFEIPFLPVAQDKGFANTMAYAHVYGSYLLIALLLLHIAAALKHHLIDGDNTVARMLPLVRERMA
jgi:cytochrome b561